MGYNYGYEVKKFKERWAKLREVYAAAGMSEEAIQEMYEFDWEQDIKRERIWNIHTQPIDGFTDSSGNEIEDDRSPYLEKHLEQFSCSHEISEWGRYDWIEDIDTPELADALKSLPEKDIELLTCLAVDGMPKADIAREQGVSRARITQRVERVKKIISESLLNT
jgi:DNA-directed RNA polymerase specialized sigma24 family protein